MKRPPDLTDFDRLFAEYGPLVFRFCHRLTGDRQEAEDLTQDVFVAAFAGSSKFRNESSPKTWLLRIAYFKARESLRRIRRAKHSEMWTEAVAQPKEGLLDVANALDALPEAWKAAFVLVKLEQFSCAEAARTLRIPEGTVKYHIYQAVQSLRNRLEEPSQSTPAQKEEPYAL